ncbi:hypothetical protein [Burkholderia ubonensis]|uniref:hypothetical protein n=1 Tax=Burkholderia ubonensis TaxID=101571 RepID=UPI0011CF9F0E|nr:hypothetical protein [Burkholderia ubonensis]
MAPKTGASLSCRNSIFMLFSVPSVTYVHMMYKPCATGIRDRAIEMRGAFNAVAQRSERRVHDRMIPSESDVGMRKTTVSVY